jgi:hypothetical protein
MLLGNVNSHVERFFGSVVRQTRPLDIVGLTGDLTLPMLPLILF